jgi:hypothetical protein
MASDTYYRCSPCQRVLPDEEKGICWKCMEWATRLTRSVQVGEHKHECPHDPRTMAGKPIGMYHCPECGDMVLAGLPHPTESPECEQCWAKWLGEEGA